MSGGQSAQNVTHQLITNTNALNAKVDNLAATLEGLTLSDDLKQHVNQQLAEVIQQVNAKDNKKQEFKVKDLEVYNGKTNLRSWLTAANLQMENKCVEGDEAKVGFVAGYLRERAWRWIEPILRERDTKHREIGVTGPSEF
jgi:hypothetical protein